jgi:tRNA 5-methylaminomethyl-2-thiouridine biosynthesis bifunctional protein
LFERAGWVRPGAVCDAMLAACGARLQRLFSTDALHLVRAQGQWQVHAGQGVVATAPVLILANGVGATGFSQAADLPLLAVRGQVTHLARGTLPELPLVVCRDAYLTPPSNGIVSVGATYDADGDAALRAASQRDNLHKMTELLGMGADLAAPLAGRVAFRCVAPDRLPLVGALPDAAQTGRIERLADVQRWPGLHGLLGYASRGLIWAPLAAELLAAQIDGEPLPIETGLAQALDPGRFLLKARRRTDGHIDRCMPLPPVQHAF